MRDLFQAFDRGGLPYLLIGGQAAILYGASQFTQDVDIWVRADASAFDSLLRALATLGAKVHKLTPPLTPTFVKRGHGFHFVIPRSGEPAVYLDVMGRPPRVGGFEVARKRASIQATPWGSIPVVAIPDLIELKKTDRPGDYEVISRLARTRFQDASRRTAALIDWTLSNAFRLDDLIAVLGALGVRERARLIADPVLGPLFGTPGEEALERAARGIAERAHELQRRGREHWRPRVQELKELRASGGLIPEGTPVEQLLR